MKLIVTAVFIVTFDFLIIKLGQNETTIQYEASPLLLNAFAFNDNAQILIQM